jgi:hypothetical protein
MESSETINTTMVVGYCERESGEETKIVGERNVFRKVIVVL